jgi:FG-GAP repeat
MRSHAARSILVLSFVSAGLTGSSSPASASGFEAHRLWSVRGDQQEGAKFGSSVASAGDVNGDGRPDLIVGAPGHDGAAAVATGKAFVFYNSAAGLPFAPSWSIEGEQAGLRIR